MNKTTILNIAIFWLALVWFIGWWVAQNKVNANEEILSLQQEKYLLEQEIREESDGWWVDEDAREECINSCRVSWNNHQNERTKNNDKRRERIDEIDKKLGLLLSR
jgi:hypothetical protein